MSDSPSRHDIRFTISYCAGVKHGELFTAVVMPRIIPQSTKRCTTQFWHWPFAICECVHSSPSWMKESCSRKTARWLSPRRHSAYALNRPAIGIGLTFRHHWRKGVSQMDSVIHRQINITNQTTYVTLLGTRASFRGKKGRPTSEDRAYAL